MSSSPTITTEQLTELFLDTRATTKAICKPLQIEDYVVQPVVEVSPPKWHLAHTTWFFEEFLLAPHLPGYKRYHPDFAFLFNSYYESIGKRVARTDRGNMSRPTVEEVYAFRDHVTAHMKTYLKGHLTEKMRPVLEIGIHHEKQHQELLRTDIKYILGHNPLLPVYGDLEKSKDRASDTLDYHRITEGIYHMGHEGHGFCYDNELGRHRVFLEDFKIADSLVTNAMWLEFLQDGGYDNVLLWHTEGWEWRKTQDIDAPLYWRHYDGSWKIYKLSGEEELNPADPVTHVSYYEAAAFAQWMGQRLPTEQEWEVAQSKFGWGHRWEWTESSYQPYPGYKKPDGAIAEYNGKFMVNQKVLRGGSIATPENHTRKTYRNFLHPQMQWQFSGVRLAK